MPGLLILADQFFSHVFISFYLKEEFKSMNLSPSPSPSPTRDRVANSISSQNVMLNLFQHLIKSICYDPETSSG
jgi:hypothetical protein